MTKATAKHKPKPRLLRGVSNELWEAVRLRAGREDRTLQAVLIRALEAEFQSELEDVLASKGETA